jgi:hypothetical protein
MINKHLNYIIIYLILTSIIVLTISPTFLISNNWLDPNVYAGYVNNYRDLYDRYGQTYYSTRIAYIYPEILFKYIFKSTYFGYLSLRIFFITFICSLIHYTLSLYYSRDVGLIYGFWILFTPWLLSSLCWTHYDGFGTGYLMTSMSLLLISRKLENKKILFIGGIFGYFATNCNLLLLPIFLIFGISVFLSEYLTLKRINYKFLMIYLFGFIFGIVLLNLIYIISLKPNPLILEKASINMALSMQGGLAKNWFISFSQLFERKQLSSFVPFFFILLIFQNLNSKLFNNLNSDQRVITLVAIFNYILLLFFALFQHFIGNVGWFSYPYYLIYFFPGASLIIFISIGNQLKKEYIYFLIFFLILFIVTNFYIIKWNLDEITIICYYILILLILNFIVSVIFKYKILCNLNILILTSLISVMLIQQPYYRFLSSKSPEWDYFNSGEIIQNYIANKIPAKSRMYFIYSSNRNGKRDDQLDSIQSRFLWGYSRLHDSRDKLVLPVNFRDKLIPNTYLVILGLGDNEIQSALYLINQQNLKYSFVSEYNFENPTGHYFIKIIQINN